MSLISCQVLEAVQQAVKVAHEVDYPLAVLGNQFVHTSDLVVIVLYSVYYIHIVLPLNLASFRLSSTMETIRCTSSGR